MRVLVFFIYFFVGVIGTSALVLNLLEKFQPSFLPNHKLLTLIVILSWCLIQAPIFIRMASWASSVPAKTVAAIPVSELKKRLLGLNSLNIPFVITEGKRPNEILIDWRYADAQWFALMSAGGMKRSYQMRMRLDEADHTARARDYESDMNWAGGAKELNFNWKGSLGIIFFQYEKETVFGLQIKDGKITPNLSYSYTFDLRELKNPVIALITSAGWNFRPVMTFFRPLGG